MEVETELETTIPSEANDTNDYQMIGVIKNIDAPESNVSNTLSSIIRNDENSGTEISTENAVVQSSTFPITSSNQFQNIKPIGNNLFFISIKKLQRCFFRTYEMI